jgi:hypothetical protein
MTMCEFCGNQQRVTNAHKAPVKLADALAGVDAAIKSLDKTLAARNQERSTTMGEKAQFAAVNREGKNVGVVEMEHIGPTPPAQQYAEPQDYFAEPRVSESKRAELEAEAAGLRTQLQSPDLTPSQKLRLEQSLTAIERILGKSSSGDARRNFA